MRKLSKKKKKKKNKDLVTRKFVSLAGAHVKKKVRMKEEKK
jgi:hypothetical protein